MKRTRHILEILLLLLACSTKTYSQKDIKIEPIQPPEAVFGGEYGIYYANIKPVLKNGQPFTGIDSSMHTEDGEKLIAVQTFKDGYKTELQTFYDNGVLECNFQWKNGKRNGTWKKNYKSGKIKFDYIMKEGKDVGTTVSYYENGYPNYISDEQLGWTLSFYENGKTKSHTQKIFDSTMCGSFDGFYETRWQENGQLYSKATYNCGPQPIKLYWNDSIIAAEGLNATSFGYIFLGKYIERYKNGKLKIEGTYSDKKAGVKNGEWKYYDETGKLILKEFYENDILKKSKPDKLLNKPKPFFDRS